MHILWCGPYLSDKAIKEKKTPDLAAVKWSRGLLGALRDMGVKITALSHCPEQLWPRGNVFWQSSDRALFSSEDECTPIGYPNLPFIRAKYLDNIYVRYARDVFNAKKIDAVLFYNVANFDGVMKLAHKLRIPAIPIILDEKDPRLDNWRAFTYKTRNASGIAFLSWWAIQNIPNRYKLPLLHLDGGCAMWNGGVEYLSHRRGAPYRLVYTGSLDKYRGATLLYDIIKKYKREDVQFILCGGKFNKEEVRKQLRYDPRVDVRGFVSEEELAQICQTADVFLNMRNSEIGENIMNYPSKIPHYLSFGKPVVSTWIDSFSPDYRSVLRVPKEDSAKAFIAEIDDILSSFDSQAKSSFDVIEKWFMKRMLWSNMAQNLIEFMKS